MSVLEAQYYYVTLYRDKNNVALWKKNIIGDLYKGDEHWKWMGIKEITIEKEVST